MSKIFSDINGIKEKISKEKRIILVGGCFDLLHVGHLHLFKYAKDLGDILVVSVLSDSYVKSYKNINRPIIKEEYRAQLVSAIKEVDYVHISDFSSSNYDILTELNPYGLVFGLEENEKKSNKTKKKGVRN